MKNHGVDKEHPLFQLAENVIEPDDPRNIKISEENFNEMFNDLEEGEKCKE